MLDTYGKHYLQLIEGRGTLPVARFGRRLQPFDTTTTHPLALRISTADMPDSEKATMFNDIVSYIVRRAVCGLTTKNYNNWFTSVLRQWIKGPMTRTTLKDLLASSPNSPAARWPDDAEFSHALQTAPTYDGNLDTGRCRMLLTELEGWLRITKRTEEPTILDLYNLDIDHILPRSGMNIGLCRMAQRRRWSRTKRPSNKNWWVALCRTTIRLSAVASKQSRRWAT